MSTDNNYDEILGEVCDKINSLDSIKEVDILEIKNSVESIENLVTDSQAKLNFQEIKEKLETIAYQVDNCNDALLKDLFNDINKLKETSGTVGQYIENLQNIQNLALTSAEFEEFQKQQLDLALKTNENIFNELNAIKENSQSADNSESLKRLETQLETLHKNLSAYIEQIVSKIDNSPNIEEIGAIMSDLGSVQQKSIKQTNSLIKDLQSKFTVLQSDLENKDLENQLAKISEIYDSLAIIRTWIDRVGFINQSIENVYARLGESIDFDEVAEKVDIIYENIGALNTWTMKIDNIDGTMTDMQSKVASLSNFINDTKNIANTISSMKEKFDATFTDEIDIEDITNKMDIVYENLTAINEWANKVDNINEKVSSINDISDKVENIDEMVSPINDIADKVDNISEKVSVINTAFEDDMISSKVDLIYENISLLNEWVNRIDNISARSDELDTKINQLTENLANAGKIIEDVPNIKDKLENLSGELNTITHSTRNDADSYIYTLLDIESDFLKLHKFLDDKTNTTTQDINSLKEKFEELNSDISSISIRTNKLILSADDANKEFKTYLDSFKNTIHDLDVQRAEFNPELKFAMLGEKINELFKLMQNSLEASKNLNNAFVYLAEWIDATGSVLNNMSLDISQINVKASNKNEEEINTLKAEITEVTDRISHLENIADSINNTSLDISQLNKDSSNKNEEAFNALKTEIAEAIDRISQLEDVTAAIKTDDISEIKSLLTGIMVQLNTSLTPDIDSLNERIDKLSEENNGKLTELETLMNEKINQQSKRIVALEEKIDNLVSKFDKLIDAMADEHNNYEIKDILNYIASQTAAANEAIASGNEKLASFDGNINKLVSYIEED